ncbi:MAG: transglutaminase-like domain-containing protein [Verrucomicrobiales bacterium]|jgi:hypothetical protein
MKSLAVLISLILLANAQADPSASLIQTALKQAGDNRTEIQKALTDAPAAQQAGMRFLIAYMPEHDLKKLSAEYLLANVSTAYAARETLPWGKDIPEERFFNDVLPYASINERRDNWRKDFFTRFAPLVKDCATPGEAAQILNRDMYKLIGVQYHANKRPNPDQSPYESIEANYASCSGLSVLLIDACRAVSIPARFAGTPRWANKRGNHSWVEVWDQGKWHFTGACEYNAEGLNKVWFLNDASHAKKDERKHAIYASSWKHTGESFPMIWARDLDFVAAVNVTDHYTGEAEQLLASGECLLGIQVWDRPGGQRIVCDVAVRSGDKILHSGKSTGTEEDTNHLFEIVLKHGEKFTLDYTPVGGEIRTRDFETTTEAGQKLDVFVKDE